MNKLEKEIEKINQDIKENKRNRIQGVLENFTFALVDFEIEIFQKDEYKKALKEAIDKLEGI